VKILLKNGEVASSQGTNKVDVLIEDGKIVKVSDEIEQDGVEVIDCSEKLILPGAIDVHVHFREPGESYKEDWESGSSAAAAGGVTTVFDMPNNKPPIVTLEALEKKREIIKGRSYVNYGLYMGFNGKNLDEVNKAKGIAGVKMYCAHSTGGMGVGEKDIEKLIAGVAEDKHVVVHAEDEACIDKLRKEYLVEFEGREKEIPVSLHSKIRSKECGVKMVEHICELAKKYQQPVHICHVSSEEELDVISRYREFGVTCEVCPHHLSFSVDDYEYYGAFIKMNPPVRDKMDVFGLWKSLKMGMVDVIATDHAPHAIVEKELPGLEPPSGVPGVEMMLPIMLHGVNNDALEIGEVVWLCSENPARLWGLNSKGKVEEGFDADVVVVDMEIERKFDREDVVSKCKWSPYAGGTYQGWPIVTIVGGEVVFRDGKIVGTARGEEVF